MPILPPHSIAKSGVKPIFSPLPHPSFFAPNLHFARSSPFRTRFRAIFREIALVFCPVKSIFFSSFLVLGPTSGTFSMARPRFFSFYRLFPFPFSHFESKLRRLFDGTSFFSAPKLTFSLPFPVLPHTSGTSSKDLTLYFLRTPFLHSVNAFPIRASLILHVLLHLPISFDFLSALHSPLPLHSLPHFLSFSSPLFHPPPQLTHERAHPRAIRAYAYIRTHLHVRRFSFIAFTASPTYRNPLCTNALGVKENEKKPSQDTQQPHNQHINTMHPISSAVNFI